MKHEMKTPTEDRIHSPSAAKTEINILPSSSSRQRLYTARGLLIRCPCLLDCLGGAFGGDTDIEIGSGKVASGRVLKICNQEHKGC